MNVADQRLPAATTMTGTTTRPTRTTSTSSAPMRATGARAACLVAIARTRLTTEPDGGDGSRRELLSQDPHVVVRLGREVREVGGRDRRDARGEELLRCA